jgi:hypothetical protein
MNVAKRDVLDIRFGQTSSVEKRARDFAKAHGQRLNELTVACRRERGKIYAQPSGASVTELTKLERERQLARLNTPAYEALTEFLEPQNLVQIQDAWLREHLKLLKEEGHIQPDAQPNRQLVEMEAEQRALMVQLTERQGAMDRSTWLGQIENEPYMALLAKRHAFAQVHQLPGIDNYYDFALAKQGLTAEDLDRFYEQVNTKTDEQFTDWGAALVSPQGYVSLNDLLAAQGIPSEVFLEEAARVIGQEQPVRKLLEQSRSDGKYPMVGADGYLLHVNPPWEIQPFINIPRGAAKLGRELDVRLHEVLGHGLNYSFLDPDLPPQFRDENPFSPISDEGTGRMWEGLLYSEDFWTKVLKVQVPAEDAGKFKRTLAFKKLLLLRHIQPEDREKAIYKDPGTRPWRSLSGTYFTYHPVHLHNYDLAMAWGVQVDEAMKAKHGSTLTKEAWEDIRKVFSLGKMLDFEEQTKLLTASSGEIDEIVGLLKSRNPESFAEGKKRIKNCSGQPFSTDALLREMDRLMAIFKTPNPPAS